MPSRKWATEKFNEKTDALAAAPHVEKQLCVMNWIYCLDTLDFDHNLIVYQQISAMTQVKLFAVINYGQAKLAENRLHPVFGVREKGKPDKRSPTILVPEQSVAS
jgi:hypothetical protein